MATFCRATLLASTVAAGLALACEAQATGFVNGDFESSLAPLPGQAFYGWDGGSGYWGRPAGAAPCGGSGSGCLTSPGYYYGGQGGNLTPSLFLPGGPFDLGNGFPGVFTLTNAGFDPNTGNVLPTVYSGNHSAKLNDTNNNYSASAIKQTVANYTDSHVYFAWAAVLEGSHTKTDSDEFTLLLTDDTSGKTLYSVTYSSAEASSAALFHHYAPRDAYWTDWQVQNLDLTALPAGYFTSGDTLTMELLGVDCPYGGHWGYVYLDGFGAAPPPSNVPEPATIAILGAGLAGLGLVGRRRAA